MIRRAIALLLTGTFVLAAACSNLDLSASRCRDIPAHGCPDDNGVECSDATCAAGYACQADGTWSLVRNCAGYRHGGPPDATTPPAPLHEAGPLPDITGIDAPPGANGGGCVDTEPPDCWLGTVLACPASSPDPCCGCESLFVCGSGGQVFWGSCTPDGGVSPAK